MDKPASGINTSILWKQQLQKPVAPARRDFVPLRSFPFAEHDRAAEMRAYAAIPSAFK